MTNNSTNRNSINWLDSEKEEPLDEIADICIRSNSSSEKSKQTIKEGL